MKHLFTGRIRLILILAVLLAVVLAVVGNLTGVKLPDTVMQGVLAPIRSGVSSLTGQVEQFYNYIFEYESLLAENQELKKQLAHMENDARQADSIARENARLRTLLGLDTTSEGYELVDGYIISRSSAEWSSTFTINRGTSAGIEEGMCAITANGELVGLVSEVGSNYAIVKSVLDSSLEISATMASSGYSGMVTGGYSSGYAKMLRMDYLPSSAVIRNEDQVVTTGSTLYPKGLLLGYITNVSLDETGVAKYASLKASCSLDDLEQVFIITDYENN